MCLKHVLNSDHNREPCLRALELVSSLGSKISVNTRARSNDNSQTLYKYWTMGMRTPIVSNKSCLGRLTR